MLFSKIQPSSYRNPGRLADVLALIQTLGLHPYQTHRNESQLVRELCRSPKSACASWTELARLHPEFFRVSLPDAKRPDMSNDDDDYVDDDPDYPVSLIARHQGMRTLKVGSSELLKIPRIEADVLKALVELAGSMHDQEETRNTKWFPLGGQFLAALGPIVGAALALIFTK